MTTGPLCRLAIFSLLAGAAATQAGAAKPVGPVPIVSPGTWVTPNDYPSSALRNEQEGITSFALTIGPDGKVADCQITLSSGTPALDMRTCDLIRERAQFSPARDARGRATTGTYRNRVRWVIPHDAEDEQPPVAKELVVSFLVGPDGTRTDCKIESAAGYATEAGMDAKFCDAGKFTEGYRDQAGTLVARRVRLTMKIEVLPAP